VALQAAGEPPPLPQGVRVTPPPPQALLGPTCWPSLQGPRVGARLQGPSAGAAACAAGGGGRHPAAAAAAAAAAVAAAAAAHPGARALSARHAAPGGVRCRAAGAGARRGGARLRQAAAAPPLRDHCAREPAAGTQLFCGRWRGPPRSCATCHLPPRVAALHQVGEPAGQRAPASAPPLQLPSSAPWQASAAASPRQSQPWLSWLQAP
jgi:hypothetical protein